MTAEHSPKPDYVASDGRRVAPLLPRMTAYGLLSVIGFSCYLFWELLGIFGSLPILSPLANISQLHFTRTCAFFVLAFVFIAVWIIAARRPVPTRCLLVMSGIFTAVVTAGALTAAISKNESATLSILVWCAYAASFATLMIAWAAYFARNLSGETPFVITSSYCMGFLLFFLFSLVSTTQGAYSSILVGAIAAVSAIGILALLTMISHDSLATTSCRQKLGNETPPPRRCQDRSCCSF